MPPVNVSQALASPAYAKQVWMDYYKCGNTMGTTAEQMGQIEAQWPGKIASWKASVATDENKYIIDDSDWNAAVKKGEQEGKDLTGYENTGWQKAGQHANVTKDAALSIAEATTRTFAHEALRKAAAEIAENVTEKAIGKAITKAGETAAKDLVKDAGKEAAKKATEEAAKKGLSKAEQRAAAKAAKKAAEEGVTEAAKEGAKTAGEEAAKEASKQASQKAGENAGTLVGCAFDIASAAAYRISQPNKTQYQAAMVVNEDLPNQQEITLGTQEYMTTMDDELITLTDDANLHVEDANSVMAEEKTNNDFYAQYVENIDHKKTAGEAISDADAEMYKEAVEKMTEAAGNVDMTKEDGETAVNEIYETMEGYQDGFDESADKIGKVKGQMEYAEGFDESTQMMCNIEGGVQTLNGGFAAWDTGKAAWTAKDLYAIPYGVGVPMAIVYTAAAVGAAAAGASDGLAAKDQFQWASEIGGEIENRKATQDMNDVSTEDYAEKVDNYATNMEDIESLEMEVPDEVGFTGEETEIAATVEDPEDPTNPEGKKKDKKDNKKTNNV